MAIAPEDRIREVTATTKRPATAAPKPTSSVPTTPVNKNIPTPIDSNPNRAVLAPDQYPMKEIVTNTGQKVMVYTSGPLAGQDKTGNFPIQATDAAAFTSGGGTGGGTGGGSKPVTYTATDGTVFDNEETYKKYQELLGDKESIADTKRREGQSAYDLLYKKFSEYGLGDLVEAVQGYIVNGLSEDELTLRLRETPAYQNRFAANKDRIAKGLTPLSEAAYIKLEDQYQEVMRQYGLPDTYWAKEKNGKQPSFEQLIANDISNTELEDRLLVAQDRVLKANPEVLKALKDFYPDIKNGDILAYTLDPKNALKTIQSKVTAAEIGGAALAQGLSTGAKRAEELAGYGVTKAQAQQGYETVAGMAPRGGQLAAIYKEDPYTQQTAETEVFNLGGSAEAKKKREKLASLETATFSGQSGRGAIDRERAGAI